MGPTAVHAISFLITTVMFILYLFPLHLASFYLIMRPLVEPFSYWKNTFVGGVPVTGIFAIVLIGSAIYNFLALKRFRLVLRNMVPLYFLLALAALSILNSRNPMMSLAHILKIVTAIAFFLLVFNCTRSHNDARRILNAFVIASILPMLYGYYQYFTGTGHAHAGAFYTGKRIDSFLYQWNAYGEFLSIEICAATMLFLQKNRRWIRIGLLAAICSMFISLVLSLNRASWISLCFAAIVSMTFYIKKIKLKWIILGSVVLFLAFGSVVVSRFEELQQRSAYGQKNTLVQRATLWKRILPLIPEHPLIGHGIGTASVVSEHYLRTEMVPHNDYLRLALEAGIPAALLYIWFLLYELGTNIRRTVVQDNWYINMPMLMAIVYFIIMSFVQNIVYNVTVLPMVFGLIAVARKWNILELQGKKDAAPAIS